MRDKNYLIAILLLCISTDGTDRDDRPFRRTRKTKRKTCTISLRSISYYYDMIIILTYAILVFGKRVRDFSSLIFLFENISVCTNRPQSTRRFYVFYIVRCTLNRYKLIIVSAVLNSQKINKKLLCHVIVVPHDNKTVVV